MNHILIVEDEDIIRNALKKLLERNHYAVSEADSIDAAKAQPLNNFQLIISDLRLPGGQGTDLITLSGNTPVLIMTSYGSMRSAVDAMKLGAVDYIAKPFDHKEMLETVARILKEQGGEESSIEQPSENNQPTISPVEKKSEVESSKVSLDDYFVSFVLENQAQFSETQLAKKLGISRKNLWERRQKLGIPRKKSS